MLDVATGNPIAEIIHVAYPLDRPDPETATIAPERLWAALLDAARQAVAACQASNASVQGIGLSYLSPALLLIDRNDRPLVPIVTHLDHRAAGPRSAALKSDCGAEFLASTGNRPLPGGMSAISWAYLVRQQPALRQQVRRYLHVDSWLGLRLTGNVAMDFGNACFTGLFDTMGRHGWSEHWCRYFDISPAWLPEVASGDATLGGLKADVADQLGLPARIPVKVGCPDTSSAILAGGARIGGIAARGGHDSGFSPKWHRFTPKPAADHLTRMLGVGEGFVQITAWNPVGGVAARDWMHQLCFHDQSSQEFYAATIPLACEHSTDVELEPPYLGATGFRSKKQRAAAFRNLTIRASAVIDLLAARAQQP